METVTSADGTRIAFERFGGDSGQPLIVVGGASCDRARMRPLSEELGRHRAVINYDRRGRGDSGDTAPYAVEREIEDLAALIGNGPASLYGHSSGAGLVLHAAAHGLPLAAIVLHEPPYGPEDDAQAAREYGRQLRSLLVAGRRGDAMALFMSITGMPDEMVDEMRRDPSWAALEALAPTLADDSEVMGDISRGGTVPVDVAARVTAPALVLSGGASPEWMIQGARRLADAMRNGSHRVLAGEGHVVAPGLLAPVVGEFVAGA
jgi:pimeloyl-ACP methyl ester carboxylesterase